jgi:hypothetical protein
LQGCRWLCRHRRRPAAFRGIPQAALTRRHVVYYCSAGRDATRPKNLASLHTPRHRRTGGPHVRERGKSWRTNYPFRVGVYWWDFR